MRAIGVKGTNTAAARIGASKIGCASEARIRGVSFDFSKVIKSFLTYATKNSTFRCRDPFAAVGDLPQVYWGKVKGKIFSQRGGANWELNNMLRPCYQHGPLQDGDTGEDLILEEKHKFQCVNLTIYIYKRSLGYMRSFVRRSFLGHSKSPGFGTNHLRRASSQSIQSARH